MFLSRGNFKLIFSVFYSVFYLMFIRFTIARLECEFCPILDVSLCASTARPHTVHFIRLIVGFMGRGVDVLFS